MNKLITEMKTAAIEAPRLYFLPITAALRLLHQLFTVKTPRS